MIEKVNPMHADKIADRISGAIVDLAYYKSDRPTVAVEVLLGHNSCFVMMVGVFTPLRKCVLNTKIINLKCRQVKQ